MAYTKFDFDPDLATLINELDSELKQSETDTSNPVDEDESLKSNQDYLCTETCGHSRKQGSESMLRCCSCMQWFHPSCCGEDKKYKGFWLCLMCRDTSKRVINLERKVDMLANLNLKLIVLLHEKDSKLSSFKSSNACPNTQNLNKTQQPRDKSARPEVKQRETQTAQMHVIQEEQAKQPSSQGQCDAKISIICDSIPICIDTDELKGSHSAFIDVKQVAPKINDAVDYVQDKSSCSEFLLIHTGTNNMSNESVTTINRRFERLENNLVHKKLKNVGLSSIVYRRDGVPDYKIRTVNRTIRNICIRNQWVFIDNDNIDESCLMNDMKHLNENGFNRMMMNFKLALSNFMKTLPKNIP